VPLQDELRQLFEQVGPTVFEDAETFRGAFDDFVPEGAATTGERRLLVDAIATGSFQRLVTQLSINADPATAISAEATHLARERGTVETDGARWALSALAFARGLTEAGTVTTRPSALGAPTPEPEDPAAYASTLTVDDPPTPAASLSVEESDPTVLRPSTDSGPSVEPRSPAGNGRSRLVVVVVAAAVLAVGVVAAIVLLGDGDTPEADRDDQDRPSSTSTSDPSTDTSGIFPEAPSGLPDLPLGFPETFELVVRLPGDLTTTVNGSFGEGVATEIFAGGDPTSPEVQADSGPAPTAERIRELVAAGIPPRVKYFTLRQVGQGGGEANDNDALLNLLANTDLMATYWTNVRDLLTELGGIDAPVELLIEQDVASSLMSFTPDATSIPTAVASTGVEGLDALPDTFAGWAQAWIALRDELAPHVRIGLSVSPWQIQNDFLPTRPTPEQAESWAARFGDSYATLGARFDFLDNIMTYSEGGALGEDYIADEQFFDRLLIWLEGISAATDTPVILDNVPVGNSVYRTIDDTDFHFRDAWVEWMLDDDDFDNLVALRDAGVIGVVFGVDGGATSTTCPCDAADDGVSNTGDIGRRSTSADDDGGYLVERLRVYAATGGLPLTS
jgi:hypothetical protein